MANYKLVFTVGEMGPIPQLYAPYIEPYHVPIGDIINYINITIMKLIPLVLFLISITQLLSQNILVLDHEPSAFPQSYSTFENAQTAAAVGDIIYVKKNFRSSGKITVIKRLALVSQSTLFESPVEIDPSSHDSHERQFELITIQENAAGTLLQGLKTGGISIDADNCVVKDCEVNGFPDVSESSILADKHQDIIDIVALYEISTLLPYLRLKPIF